MKILLDGSRNVLHLDDELSKIMVTYTIKQKRNRNLGGTIG